LFGEDLIEISTINYLKYVLHYYYTKLLIVFMFIITKFTVSLLNLFKGLLPQHNKFPLYSMKRSSVKLLYNK